MDEGEQDLPFAVTAEFLGHDLPHLVDHLSLLVDRIGVGDDRPGGGVFFIREAGPCTGAGLDQQLVTAARQLQGGRRHNGHTKLVVLDFLRYSDNHSKSPPL